MMRAIPTVPPAAVPAMAVVLSEGSATALAVDSGPSLTDAVTVTCECTVTPFCSFDVGCARPVSAESGASEAKRDSPPFVGPGGVDVADSSGWDDASSEFPLPVEADGDEVVV
jgi:hypothetical protein